ncbi:MAG: hypothetical protein AB1Z98_30850 [Nannocystaceae bacterium]
MILALCGAISLFGPTACDTQGRDGFDLDREEDGCDIDNPPACELPFPLCEGTPTAALQAVAADSEAEFLRKLLGNVDKVGTLKFGAFDAASNSIRATEDSGYYKILFELSDDFEQRSSVDNLIVAESDVPLWEWNWYREDYNLISEGMVWGAKGWTPHDYAIVDADSHPDAVPYEGKYYYLMDTSNANVPDVLVSFISSKGSPATVKFYAQYLYNADGSVSSPF